jgi:hypothetical protein
MRIVGAGVHGDSMKIKGAGISIAVGVILLLIVGPLLISPVSAIKPVLDRNGQQVWRDDGRPKYEHDPIGDLKTHWYAYAIMASGAALMLYGIGCACHRKSSYEQS